MKRLLVLLCVAILTVSIFIVYDNNITGMSNILNAVSDRAGNMYVIDNKDYKSRLLKINSNGKLDYIIKAKVYKEGYFTFFADLAVDDDGNVYVAETKVNSDTYEAVTETIAQYDKKGRFVRDIYSTHTSQKEQIWLSDIKSISCDGNYVYVYSAKDGWGEVFAISLKNAGVIEKRLDVKVTEEVLLSETFVHNMESAFVIDKYGRMYHVGADGKGELLYPSVTQDSSSDNSIPVGLSMDSSNGIYFTDLKSFELIRIDMNTLEQKTVLSGDRIIDKEHNITFSDLRNVKIDAKGNIIGSFRLNGKSCVAVIDGDKVSIYKDLDFQLERYLIFAVVLVVGLVVLYFILLLLNEIFVKVMNRKIPIALKQLVVLVPFIILSMVVMSRFVTSYITKIVDDEIYAQLYSISKMVAEKVDTDKIKALTSPEDFMSDTYLSLQNDIEVDFTDFQKLRKGGYSKYMYSEIYRYMDGEIRAIINTDGYTVTYPKKYMSENETVDIPAKEVYRDDDVKISEYADSRGIWMCAFTPIHDETGEIVGVLEMGIGKATYNDYVKSYSNRISVLNLSTTGLLVIILLVILLFSLRPLRALQKGVGEIAAGKLDTVVETGSRDEMGDLARVINKMSGNLRTHIEKITKYNQAYYKFVPQQFMSLLGKESVLEVELGEYIKKEVNILVLNIRDFYEISNNMPPEEIFKLINNAFSIVAPVIRENEGIIVKYTDTGLIAFFPADNDSALKAAVMIQESVRAYNDNHRNSLQKQLDIGVAIHNGLVMLGIIGEEMRLEASAISEEVHLTSMMRELGAEFGSNIIVSDEFVKAMGKGSYSMRYVGQILYKSRRIFLYDCFDGDSAEIKLQKRENREKFEEGVKLYGKGDLYNTRLDFIEVVKRSPADKMAKIYLYLSDEYLNAGKPEDWDPAVNYNMSFNMWNWEK